MEPEEDGNNNNNNDTAVVAVPEAAPSAKPAAPPPPQQKPAMDWEPPAACINRIVKVALPEHVQVTKEAKAAFSKSAGIFILYLTTCANDFCRDKKRQTVSAHDVMQAVSELEFDEFKGQLQAFLTSFRAHEGAKRKPTKAVKEEDDDDEPMLPDEEQTQPHIEPITTTTTAEHDTEMAT